VIKEVTVAAALDYEYPPETEPLTVLDAYDGCLFDCPYCFQQRDPSWNKDISVKTNFVEVLKTELDHWPENSLICVGSRSDPYMLIERKYRLTRQCLQLLNERNIPVIITTKSDPELILADLDLFTHWNNTLEILVGFSNLKHYQHLGTLADLPPLVTLKALQQAGVTAKAFIAPVLPGITDVEHILEHIAPEIPVYLDKLRIDDRNGEAFLAYIQKHHPSLTATYEEIIYAHMDSYYRALCQNRAVLARCGFSFLDSQARAA
jgi:DNA repair photolyase